VVFFVLKIVSIALSLRLLILFCGFFLLFLPYTFSKTVSSSLEPTSVPSISSSQTPVSPLSFDSFPLLSRGYSSRCLFSARKNPNPFRFISSSPSFLFSSSPPFFFSYEIRQTFKVYILIPFFLIWIYPAHFLRTFPINSFFPPSVETGISN